MKAPKSIFRCAIEAMAVLYLCIAGVLTLPILVFAACTGFKFFEMIPLGDVVKFCLGFPLAVTVFATPLCLLYGVLAEKYAPHRPRRTPEGLCTFCGYDLAGLAPDAVCPECGGRDS